jgi:hypothetical protein
MQLEEYHPTGVLFWGSAWVDEAYRQANSNLRDGVAAQ